MTDHLFSQTGVAEFLWADLAICVFFLDLVLCFIQNFWRQRALMVSASMVSAATVEIASIMGVWDNTVTAGGGTASGEGTSFITFGNTSGTQSGYDFAATSTPFTAGNPFDLGVSTHDNFVIYGGSLQSADLLVNVMGTIDGTAFSLAPIFSFMHDETTNSTPCNPVGATVCPDVVTFANAQDLSEIVNVGGEDFTVTIEGFQVGGSLVSAFTTEEGQSNSATLVASISAPAPVPLPAAGWGLLMGIGALGAMRRRKATSHQA